MPTKLPILPEDDHTVQIGDETLRFTKDERGWNVTWNDEPIAYHISSYTRAYEIALEEVL
jgi:hypothetical protein